MHDLQDPELLKKDNNWEQDPCYRLDPSFIDSGEDPSAAEALSMLRKMLASSQSRRNEWNGQASGRKPTPTGKRGTPSSVRF